MSPLEIVAVAMLAAGAASTLVAVAHRREKDPVGSLSTETLRRDRGLRDRARARVRQRAEVEQRARSARSASVTRWRPGACPDDGLTVASTTPIVWVPPTPETLGVTRRMFLNRSIVVLVGFGTAVFASAAFTAFLWPTGVSGFGSKLAVGKINDILASIDKADGFLYVSDGRMWITRYPPEALSKAQLVYKGEPILDGMQAGIVALYQKCPHLGCRVPACLSSQWFECPCHGSQYSRVGEKRGGPAPRGMDRFAVEVSGSSITVDTATVVTGPPIGTDTTGQEPQGPHCVSGSAG